MSNRITTITKDGATEVYDHSQLTPDQRAELDNVYNNSDFASFGFVEALNEVMATNYKGYTICHRSDNRCSVNGRIFPSVEVAKAAIDLKVTLDTTPLHNSNEAA